MQVISHDDCWWFAGHIDNNQYGRVFTADGYSMAHRVMYENHHGELPVGLVLDHVCRVKPCINPEHLELVTDVTNKMRGLSPAAQNVRKTHCIKGHAYDEDNTYIDKRGYRVCRACDRDR